MQIILASKSPFRQSQLQQLGVPFKVHASDVNENEFKAQFSDLEALAATLAFEKAKNVQAHYSSEDIIIGCDQLGDLNGQLLEKPKTKQRALERLAQMQGQTHRLITSICLLQGTRKKAFTNITQLKMRSLSESQILTYLDLDEPYECAGGYKIEQAGISLFETIHTSDFTAIVGLPLIELTTQLTELLGQWPPEWKGSNQ